ncbi:hypothetical protein KJ966_14895 [bacterium]|nr:hypothetical protein [bacterium]
MPDKIAVKGMGIISALGKGKTKNVEMLKQNSDRISPLTLFPNRESIPVCQIEDIPADTVNRNDEFALLAIEEALEDAGLAVNTSILSNAALLLGNTTVDALEWEHKIRKDLANGNKHDSILFGQGSMAGTLSSRIAERIGLTGIVLTYSTSCTSSANALVQGVQLLQSNRAERVLVVGTESLTSVSVRGFSSLSLLDSKGCFPFDRNRSGLLLGEGAAAILLEKVSSNDDSVDPVILSGFNSCDLSHPTASEETGIEGARAMESAIADAGIKAEMIKAVKTHGTGSPNNDLAEGRALVRVFKDRVPPFVSLKRYFGHALGASGIIEIVAFLSCIQRGFIPASIGFSELDPDINLKPLSENLEVKNGCFLFNSFGFGGNMVSIVIEV